MITTKVVVTLQCSCGSEISGFETVGNALKWLVTHDWVLLPDGEVRCSKCAHPFFKGDKE